MREHPELTGSSMEGSGRPEDVGGDEIERRRLAGRGEENADSRRLRAS